MPARHLRCAKSRNPPPLWKEIASAAPQFSVGIIVRVLALGPSPTLSMEGDRESRDPNSARVNNEDLSEKIINLYWSVYCAEGIGTSSGSQEWKANLSWVLAALAPRRSSSGCFMLVHLRRPTSRINIILDEIHFSVFSALFSLILTNSGQTTIAVLASKNIVSPVRRIPVGGLSYGTDDHSLRDEFAKYGEVVEGIKLIAALGGLLKNGLSYGTDDHSLRVEFAKYGEVVEGTLFIVALALALLFADQLCFNLSN
ncbi:hypothetical protein ZEAMMB73_Zm00001d027470 [Zea mays]|uniref:RRM domain-containing protein n=1 Tax=Zea mays TaxID=4577 RepID=A0A1D6JMC8_MAIZE|nr:hypothetical protein ZEAMMB73_Zm00001d027470 [Zea mays]